MLVGEPARLKEGKGVALGERMVGPPVYFQNQFFKLENAALCNKYWASESRDSQNILFG